jgi:hypothetical protein
MNCSSILFKAFPVACALAFLGPKTAMADSPKYIFTKLIQTQPATTQDPSALIKLGAPAISDDGTVVFYGLGRPSTTVTTTATSPALVRTDTITSQTSALYKRLTNGTIVQVFPGSNFSRVTTYKGLSGTEQASKECNYEAPRVSGKNTIALANCIDSTTPPGGRSYRTDSRSLLLAINGQPLPSPVASGFSSQSAGRDKPASASLSGTTVAFDQFGKVYTFNGSQTGAQPVEVAPGRQPLVDQGNLLFFGFPGTYTRINGIISDFKLPPAPSGVGSLSFGNGDIKGGQTLFSVAGSAYQAIYIQQNGKQTKLLDSNYKLASENRRFASFENIVLGSANSFGFLETSPPATDGSVRRSIYVSSRAQVKPMRVLSTNASIATITGNVPIKNFSVSAQYLQGKKVVVLVELADGSQAIYLGKPQDD